MAFIRAYLPSGRFQLSIFAGLIFVGLLMYLIADARLAELESSVSGTGDGNGSYRTLSLITKYMMLRDRNIDYESNTYAQEAKLTLSLASSVAKENLAQTSWLRRIGYVLLDFTNLMLSGQRVQNRYKSVRERNLESAFMYEITRNYVAAVEYYDLVIADSADSADDHWLFALIHRGFCLGLLEQRGTAIEQFKYILSVKPPEEYRVTAEALLTVLTEFDEKHKILVRMPDSDLKAEKLYELAAFAAAAKIFEKNSDRARTVRGQFIAGRSFEEAGQAQKAIAQYRALISRDLLSPWARAANRRLFLMGALYSPDAAIVAEAENRARNEIADGKFTQGLKPFQTYFEETKAKFLPASPKKEIIEVQPETNSAMPMRDIKSDAKKITRSIERVNTLDGSLFVGSILTESGTSVTLFTSLGTVVLNKKDIASRTRIR